MKKELLFSDEAREKLKQGVDIVANAVKVTLGAKGRNVIIDRSWGNPHITKDGVTVAREIELKDKAQNVGAQMIKEVATKTAELAGDGPQPLYSKVLTPNGWTTMGELKVGDVVCGTNGSTQTVDGIFPRGKKRIVKITFSNKQVVECCEDHLWQVTTHYNSTKILPTKELIKDYVKTDSLGNRQLKYYIPTTQVEYNKPELELDAYLVGILIGDGCLRDSGSIELSLGYKKKHIIDKIKLPEGITFSVKEYADKNYFRVKFKGADSNNRSLRDILETIGLKNLKSENKFIPECYLRSSIEDRTSLLKGLLDTDGYINHRGLFEFSTISDTLSDNFIELCRSLDLSVIYKKHNRDNDINSYSNTPINRITQLKGYKNGLKISKIELTNEYTEMQCIKVSNGNSLYITDGFTVTHNTTTSTVLAQAIVTAGLKNVTAGANPMDLKRGIDKAVFSVVEDLRKISKVVGNDFKKIEQVATISANNDNTIGSLIAQAMSKVGSEGVITVEEAKGSETEVKIVEGMQFDRGYLSPHFITNNEKMNVTLENPYILITDEKISSIKDILHILEKFSQESKELLIIAEDVELEALSTMIINKKSGALKIVAVKAPGFGDRRRAILEDIAILTGGTMIAKELGFKLSDVRLAHLGRANKVTVDKDNTTIVEGKGDKDKVEERKVLIKSQIEKAASDYDKEKAVERLAKLSGGVAVMFVGAATEVEMKEKKDRVEDALAATRAAVEEGIVAGGGVAYIRALKSLESLKGINEDEQTGINIIKRAIEEPLRVIVTNAGLEASVILNKVKEGKDDYGYNVKTDVFENLIATGIIDPTKVTRVALENAASIASMLLTTECLIIEDEVQPEITQ